MSSTQNIFPTQNQDTVLVQGFKNHPARLRLIGRDGPIFLVSGKDVSRYIGVPPGIVFKFNERLFGDLKKADTAGNRAKLASLWLEAEPYRPASAA